ncbi:transposase [Paenibacillus macerans]|uniref:transposase n=1 Tax=Paenibacillus TaxID=44249 RepID=UPI00097B0402|nr:transposase [Paenibacillus macerans]MED4957409.1 transposase [Paenibacillus macerans]OMG45742.1 transposase [Paenibacillus macerans]GJM77504.1 transposase [Paenibacillus macerans]
MGERQRYNEEFKKQAVKYVQEQTKTLPEIAEEMNIPVGTLKNWMTKYRSFENEPIVNTEKLRQLEERLQASEREKEDLQEELAILKKALHIFSKERN